jgi:hypothetical protein
MLSLEPTITTPKLSVDRAIMHLLDPDGNNTKLVHREINLHGQKNEPVREFLCRLVQSAIEHVDAYAVDATGTSDTLSVCWHMLATESTFAPQSRDLAIKLNDIMVKKGTVSAGDLLVVIAQDASGPMVGLLKLERSTDFVHEYVTQPDGTVEVRITATDAVIPPDHQKCAFVREPSPGRGYQVELHDDQVTRGKKGDAAKFFHRDFLQCELLTTQAARTYNFCTAAEDWRKKHRAFLPKQGIVSFTRALHQHLKSPEFSFDAFALTSIGAASDLEWHRLDLTSMLQARVYSDMLPEDRPNIFQPHHEAAEKLLSTISLVTPEGVKLSGGAETMERILEALDKHGEDADNRLSFTVTVSAVERRFTRT